MLFRILQNQNFKTLELKEQNLKNFLTTSNFFNALRNTLSMSIVNSMIGKDCCVV